MKVVVIWCGRGFWWGKYRFYNNLSNKMYKIKEKKKEFNVREIWNKNIYS